ncbi:two-component system sensor histidine kinase NtrB [Desulfovibrio sp.]
MSDAEEKALREDYCLYESGEGEYRVAVLGTGPGFLSIVDLLTSPDFHDFLPGFQLVAVAEPGPDPSRLRQVEAARVPVYPSFEAMWAAHPDIRYLVELTGRTQRIEDLRRILPPTVSLVDHAAAVFFCGLRDMAKMKTHCEVSLDRQRNLLQAIIDEVREDILVLDLRGRVVDMNRNVWQRTGRPKEDLLGKPCFEVMTLRDGLPFCRVMDRECPFHKTLAGREAAETLMTRVNAEGRLLYFRIYAYPILDALGSMTHIMVMQRDITSRTYREKHQQQADRLSVIGEMSTYLAHEIRNPLFAIGGFTNALLRSPEFSGPNREKLTIIAEETKRLDHMLTSILNFARPTGAPTGSVDISRLAADTAELMEIGYARRGYEFQVNCPAALPKVSGEAELIKQCLVNLYKNSIEAMPQGGIITTDCGLEGDFVFLRVADRGQGMSGQDLEKACSPFYTTKEQGYGLGLAMIKKIVEEFGGRIDIQSRLGEGTAVTLYLPPMLAVRSEAAPAP